MDTPPDGTRVNPTQRADVPVAIIDDEELHRRAIRRLLQNKGFSVRDFACPDEALRSGALFGCELILLDVMLGRESGIVACRRLRELGYSGGIIMVSCLGQSEVKAQALDAGADDYVTKPAGGRELRARLRSVLRRVQPAARASRAGGQLRQRMVLEALKSPSHRRMFRQLSAARGQPVQRDALKAFGLENPRATDKALEKHIERMREILQPLGVRIETVVGTGYSCPTRFD